MIRHQRLWTISHGWLSNIGLAFSIVLCEGASMASRTRSGGPYLLATRYRPGTTSTLGSGEASAFSVGLPGRAHRGLSSSETNDRTMASVSGKNEHAQQHSALHAVTHNKAGQHRCQNEDQPYCRGYMLFIRGGRPRTPREIGGFCLDTAGVLSVGSKSPMSHADRAHGWHTRPAEYLSRYCQLW
jgi:hypothetical protein